MVNGQFVMREEEYGQIIQVIGRLIREANAKSIFLVDKSGQLVAECGELKNIDTAGLASLTAGNFAASGGLAKLLGEKEFPVHFHQGERDNLHMSLVGDRTILVVVFDERSSLGLVKLRVKKANDELASILEKLKKKDGAGGADTPFADITDEDIDNLFND
ncbi:MAG: roadblock/LC7 domain-containing protein [Deltaproteobacteria bacterium]|nr:roadblock/LC7 domain-containing protein [Deltaproteobacteria bacterium]